MARPKKDTSGNDKQSSQYYEVQKIVGKQVGSNGKCRYKIRWKGYTEQYDTWEPIQHLKQAKQLIQQFQLRGNQIKKKLDASKKIQNPEQQKIFAEILRKQPESQIQHQKTATELPKVHKIKKLRRKQKLNQGDSLSYYKVEKIIDKKYIAGKNIQHYRIRWIGFPSSQDTWQPIQNLQSCKKLLEQFNQKYKTKPISKKNTLKEGKYYKVQKILDKRIVNQLQQYKIRWKGCSENDDTWQPKKNLSKIPKLLEAFNKNLLPPSVQTQNKIPLNIQRTSPRDQVVSLMKQSDNYQIGGENIQSEGACQQFQSDLLMQNNENDVEGFLPLNFQQQELIQPDFI